MNEKKYELTKETMKYNGIVLHRIKALKDFNDVKKGDLGGWIEKEDNLSQEGDCWIYNEAQVCDNACVCGNVEVYDNAKVWGRAQISDNVHVCGRALVYGEPDIHGSTKISGCAVIYGEANISGDVEIYGNAHVCGNAFIYGKGAVICGNTNMNNYVHISNNACINGDKDYIYIKGFGIKPLTFFRCKTNEIMVNREQLTGVSLNDFIVDINKVCEDDNKLGEIYKSIINMVKLWFDIE